MALSSVHVTIYVVKGKNDQFSEGHTSYIYFKHTGDDLIECAKSAIALMLLLPTVGSARLYCTLRVARARFPVPVMSDFLGQVFFLATLASSHVIAFVKRL